MDFMYHVVQTFKMLPCHSMKNEFEGHEMTWMKTSEITTRLRSLGKRYGGLGYNGYRRDRYLLRDRTERPQR